MKHDPWNGVPASGIYQTPIELALLDLKKRLEVIESSVRKSDVEILKNRISELEAGRVEMSSLTYTDVSRYVDTRLGLAMSIGEVLDCEHQVWCIYDHRRCITNEQYVWLRARIVSRGKELGRSGVLPDRVLSGDR